MTEGAAKPQRRPSFLQAATSRLHAITGGVRRATSDADTERQPHERSSFRKLVSLRALRRHHSEPRPPVSDCEALCRRELSSTLSSTAEGGVASHKKARSERTDQGGPTSSAQAPAERVNGQEEVRAESGRGASTSGGGGSWFARRFRRSHSSASSASRSSSTHSDSLTRQPHSRLSRPHSAIVNSSASPVGDQVERVASCLPGCHPERRVHDHYLLGAVLGVGTFSVVKLATDRRTGTEWACKIVQLTTEKDSDQDSTREEIVHEVELLTSLKHPNIMHVREYFEEGDRMYVITEMLHGGELLKAVMERGSYTEDDARQVFKQLLQAVQYMHSRGVVHRDIKLENLILANKDDITFIKIADFGLATRAQGRTLTAVCGTPQYVAPEVLKGSRGEPYDFRCDIWSCGIVLFNMLAGYPPFHSESVPKLLRQVACGMVDYYDPVWELISEDAIDLLSKFLTADPDKRISADEALRHPWIIS